MSIDEAIKHCEEVAYQNEILMKRYDDVSGYSRSHNEQIRTSGAKGCEQLISLYRQLAEWLRELKEIKHLFSITEKLFKANFRGGLIDIVDGYDILFSEHKQLREIFEEVNADADSN